MKRLVLSLTLVVAVVALAIAMGAGGGQEPPPPTPEWVGPDGKIDKTKLPKYVLVAGPDGELVRCKNGKLLKVKPDFGPPPITPLQGVPIAPLENAEAEKEKVYVDRCGKGKNPDLNPVVVEVSEDPLRKP